VKLLDTNLWVFGTLGTNARAEQLLTDIERGEITSAINAYMIKEALAAFDRTPGLTGAERDEIRTLFLTRLSRMTGLVEAPATGDLTESLLAERRANVHTQLIAALTSIQPKDVPILVLAFSHRDREPTVLTNDSDFAAFTPSDHGLPRIRLEHVE